MYSPNGIGPVDLGARYLPIHQLRRSTEPTHYNKRQSYLDKNFTYPILFLLGVMKTLQIKRKIQANIPFFTKNTKIILEL